MPTSPPGLDLDALAGYLATHRPGLARGPLSAELIAGGRSNLTYVVRDRDGGDYVLRRPPLGHVLATAHDMGREYRVISALVDTPVPVPRTLLHCPDESVLGAPFYLMERVPGTVYRYREQTDPLGADGRERLAFEMVDILAALHAVDPDKVGLGDFGHPEGYLARNLRRWAGQLDRSRSRDVPGIDALRDRLAATLPDSAAPAIVHGDFRLANLMVDPDSGRIAAVLDWEMATVGDPLTDVGLLLTYWGSLGGDDPLAEATGTAAGFPAADALVERYGSGSGRDTSRLDWYVAFGCYKLAVIAEGIHYRYTQGKTVGEGFERMGDMVVPLVSRGLALTREA
jgi:aminoglycoside phosphotransferase (APT) family kinase protein